MTITENTETDCTNLNRIINKALMADLDKISKKDEEQILNLYYEYRKSELSGNANIDLLEKINNIF